MSRLLPRLTRGLGLAASLAVAGVALAATPADSPADLTGAWLGEIRRGAETDSFGLEFDRQPDGRITTRLWLPKLNAYGSDVGPLTLAEGKFSLPAIGTALALDQGTLSGHLFASELAFTLRPGGPLPTEPVPPAVPLGPEPTWVYHANAALWTSPVVADGVAYLGDVSGLLHAINTADGSPAWTFNAHTPIYSQAAVTTDAVYFTGDNGQVFKLDRRTGAELWHAEIGGGAIARSLPSPDGGEWDAAASTPIVSENQLFVGSADGTLRVLAADSGQPLWQFKTGGKIRAAALVAGDRVYTGSTDHFVYALDRRTGALLWRFDTGSAVTNAPVLAGDNIVIGTRDRALLFALDATDGHVVWDLFFWLSWVESAPVLVDGRLYIGSSDSRQVRAIDPANGHVDWSAQVWGWTWGTPLVVGDTVYFGTAATPKYFISHQASLGAVDRATGALKWRRPIPFSPQSYVTGIPGSLALAGDRLLAAALDGTVTAYPLQ